MSERKSGSKMQYFLLVSISGKNQSGILVIFHGAGLQAKAASEKAVV